MWIHTHNGAAAAIGCGGRLRRSIAVGGGVGRLLGGVGGLPGPGSKRVGEEEGDRLGWVGYPVKAGEGAMVGFATFLR
jgi:hypothetical protein